MTDIWLPNWPRVPLRGVPGKPYQFTHNPKGCLHTTEGGSIAGARNAYASYPPHLVYDWRDRGREQHIPLNLAAYSAMDGNDDDYMIQVELVGFARETRNWPEEALRNIAADVIAPLERHFGIPRNVIWKDFKDERDGIVLASPNSPVRVSRTELRDFSGWLGHQHLPAPDSHWDPGALPIARILDYQEDDVSWTDKITVASPGNRDYTENQEAARFVGDTYFWMSDTYQAVGRLEEKLDALAARPVPDVDIDEKLLAKELAKRGLGGTDPAAIAEAVRAAVARARKRVAK